MIRLLLNSCLWNGSIKSRSWILCVRGMASEPAIQNVEVFEQKSTCGRRWQLHENLVLIAGKENQELELEKAKKEKIEKTNKEKWEEIETYCHQNGIDRSAEQCRLRWHRLILAFSKVKNWESRRRPGKLSFWLMKADERREKGLPYSLDWEAFNALDELHNKKGITSATTHFLSEKADSSKFKSTEIPSYEVNLRQHIVDEAETEGCAEEPSTCMGIGQESIIFSHDSSNVVMKSTQQTQDIQYDDRPPVIANAIMECLNYLKVVEHKSYEHECRSANFFPDHREEVSGVTESMNAALEPAKTQVDVGQKSGMDTLDKNGENLEESSGPETSSTVLHLEVALKGGNVNPVSYTRGEESEDRKVGPTTVLLEDLMPPLLNADGDNHAEGHASIFHEPLTAASPLSHKEDCAGMLNSVFDHGNKRPLKGLIEDKTTYDEICKSRVTTNTAKDLKVDFVGGLDVPMRSLEVNEDSPGVRKMVHFSTRKEDGCWEDDNKIRHQLLNVGSIGDRKGIAEAFDGVLEHSNKPYTRPKKNESLSNEKNESCQKPSIGINGDSEITATAEDMKVTVKGENGHLINYSEWNEESQCKQVVSLVDGRCDGPQKVEYIHIHQQCVIAGSWEQFKEEVGHMKDRRNDVLELDSELRCKGSIKGEETYAENAETFDKLDEGSIKGSDMCNDKVDKDGKLHQGFNGHSDPMPRAEVAGNNDTEALVDLTKGKGENES